MLAGGTAMKSEVTNRTSITFEGDDFDLPLDRDFLFSDSKGVYRKKIEKRQKKLIGKIPEIKKFLGDGEKILFLSTGCSPASFLEQMLAGSIFIYLKRSLFVFTDRRLFHIPTKKDFSYRNAIAQIIYADCRSIEFKGSKMVVGYKNGEKEKFLYIPRHARKKIKALLPNLSFEGSPTLKQKRVHLCPRCTHELEEEKYTCPSCHLEFKGMSEARKISIIYPGGGYFYTGHPFLGLGDAIVETILLIFVVISLIGVTKGVRGSGTELAMFAVFLGLEKMITIYHSNHFIKEYIPKEKEIRPIT
jgi:hypothetical protein